MATMSMNKVIHRAFRRDLDRFVDALGRFRAGDHERAKGLGLAWDNFEDQLTHHHTGEHEIAWPALEQMGVSRELLDQMDAEHDVMAAALGDTLTAMTRFRTSASAEDAAAAKAAFEQLRTVTVNHLDHEEAEIEPVYLANMDHPAAKEMGKKFAKVSPARGWPVLRLAGRRRHRGGDGSLQRHRARTRARDHRRRLRARLPQDRRARLAFLSRQPRLTATSARGR